MYIYTIFTVLFCLCTHYANAGNVTKGEKKEPCNQTSNTITSNITLALHPDKTNVVYTDNFDKEYVIVDNLSSRNSGIPYLQKNAFTPLSIVAQRRSNNDTTMFTVNGSEFIKATFSDNATIYLLRRTIELTKNPLAITPEYTDCFNNHITITNGPNTQTLVLTICQGIIYSDTNDNRYQRKNQYEFISL